MKKLGILCLLIALLVTNTKAQTNYKTDTIGSILVKKDSRLDLLVKKKTEINETSVKNAQKTSKGYRILIISTNNRNEAFDAKTKIYNNFPDLKPYLWHQSPYYKVKAGNFKDRKEAEVYVRKLKPYFPKGVFIMNDTIEVKPEKEKPETDD